MRRFSSEGSLLDLDLPWKRVALRSSDHQENRVSGACRPHTELEGGSASLAIPEPKRGPGEAGRRELSRERSVSAENLDQQGGRDPSLLRVRVIGGGCRAYSDGQLAFPPQGSTESVGREEPSPPSPPSSSSSLFFWSRHHKPKVSSARLHLRSLFGQSPSNPDLSSSEQRDGATERRSRLLFLHQWSQVDHSRKRRVSLEELQDWAQSLNALLASQNGPTVFGAFLRSEYSEENLQFYLSCEQYRQSSSRFTLHRRARDICSTYIQPGAPREVNLDSKTRDLTMQLLKAPSHNSLCHAQKRIYSLLDTDCYPRFLQSSIYLSLLQEAAERQPPAAV